MPNKNNNGNNNGEVISVPISDTPSGGITPVMVALIIINLVMFALQYFLFSIDYQINMLAFSFNGFIGGNYWTILTCMFVHYPPQLNLMYAIAHIGGNMFFLYLFFNNVEQKWGYWTLPIYIVGGMIASLVFGIMYPDAYLMGASGAIAVMMGAYFILFPKNKIKLLCIKKKDLENITSPEELIELKNKIWYKEVSAYYYLGAWVLMQVSMFFAGEANGVAVLAHMIGFGFGCIIAMIYIYMQGGRLLTSVFSVDDYIVSEPRVGYDYSDNWTTSNK